MHCTDLGLGFGGCLPDGKKARKPTFNEQLICARLSAHVTNLNLFGYIGVVHHGDTPQACSKYVANICWVNKSLWVVYREDKSWGSDQSLCP